MVQFRAGHDRNKKANEIVSGLVGLVMKEGDIVDASDSKSKLCKHLRLKRAIQDWNMKYLCRRCGESRISVESVHQQ